jgi:hypothetical protein
MSDSGRQAVSAVIAAVVALICVLVITDPRAQFAIVMYAITFWGLTSAWREKE